MVKPGELLTRLRALLAELTGGEQAAVLEFLSDPSARRIALAGSATEKAQAVNDWLNAHELAGPPASVGTDGLPGRRVAFPGRQKSASRSHCLERPPPNRCH